MAIDKPIIAAGPTTWRTAAPAQQIRSTLSDPSALTPNTEGELCIYWVGAGSQRAGWLYVGVDISGTLTFKKVKTTTAINGYTGKTFDSLGSIRNSTLN